MTDKTKKVFVTVINIVIFIGNALISFINGGEVATVTSLATGFLTGAIIG